MESKYHLARDLPQVRLSPMFSRGKESASEKKQEKKSHFCQAGGFVGNLGIQGSQACPIEWPHDKS